MGWWVVVVETSFKDLSESRGNGSCSLLKKGVAKNQVMEVIPPKRTDQQKQERGRKTRRQSSITSGGLLT